MPITPISPKVRREVLIEAGFRCAVPTCRSIGAIDLHHIIEVKEGGSNEASNLIALCATCPLYTRGNIPREAIDAWKTMLVALNHAFDQESISNLLFLHKIGKKVDTEPEAIFQYLYDKTVAEKISKGSPYNGSSIGDIITRLNLLLVSGDGVLKFSHLIASDLASYSIVYHVVGSFLYSVYLTEKGKRIVEAWFSGNREAVKEALNGLPQMQNATS